MNRSLTWIAPQQLGVGTAHVIGIGRGGINGFATNETRRGNPRNRGSQRPVLGHGGFRKAGARESRAEGSESGRHELEVALRKRGQPALKLRHGFRNDDSQFGIVNGGIDLTTSRIHNRRTQRRRAACRERLQVGYRDHGPTQRFGETFRSSQPDAHTGERARSRGTGKTVDSSYGKLMAIEQTIDMLEQIPAETLGRVNQDLCDNFIVASEREAAKLSRGIEREDEAHCVRW